MMFVRFSLRKTGLKHLLLAPRMVACYFRNNASILHFSAGITQIYPPLAIDMSPPSSILGVWSR